VTTEIRCPEQPESLPEAVREQLGLEALKAERRMIEVLVVRSTSS
jgi:hypothetical protein